MAAGRCFSMLALLLVCAVWGAWLNYIATALKGRNKVYWLKYKPTHMSCWIPKGFLFFFFFFNWDFQLLIVRVLKTKSIFTIVIYAAREHKLVTLATCAIAYYLWVLILPTPLQTWLQNLRFRPFVRLLAIARARSWSLWATIGCFAI